MAYLVAADITDKVISNGVFSLTDYLDEADDAVNALAETHGIYSTDLIETDPLHYLVKRYAISYLCMRVCQDKMGVNNVDFPDSEKYAVKYDMYSRAIPDLRNMITRDMLTGTVDEVSDRSISSGLIIRT